MSSFASRPSRLTVITAALVALGAPACAGNPAFSTSFPDNRAPDVQRMLADIQDPARVEPAVAVGITPAPQKLYAVDLASGSTLWQTRVQATYGPYLAGDVVVVQEGQEVVGRDVNSGDTRFVVDSDGMTLHGADGDGRSVALSLTRGAGTGARSRVMALRGGSIRWRHSLEHRAGVPAVAGSTVLVPWGSQYLSALDVDSGVEYARIRVRDAVIGHAFVDDGVPYAGSHQGIFRLTPELGGGRARQAPFFALEPKQLPGQPLLLRDVYANGPALAPDGAQHRIRLSFKPDGQGPLGLQGERLYLIFYRIVMALHPDDYQLEWLHTHPVDIVGATAGAGGVMIADEQGRLSLLDVNSGATRWSRDTGHRATAVTFSGPFPSGPPGEPSSADARRAQLVEAAQSTDARLVPARTLAIEFLAELDDAAATGSLVEICADRRNPPGVRELACAKLTEREQGLEHVLQALKRHAGFLQGTKAPPVGALAKAAAHFGDTRAVGLLVSHLEDPDTPSENLVEVVESLETLGDGAAAAPLSDFFRLYHADGADQHLVAAVSKTADALVTLQGQAAAGVLEQVANDPLGTRAVRHAAEQALKVIESQKAAAERAEAQEGDGAPQDREPQSRQEPKPPERLTSAHVDRILLPVRRDLKACLRDAEPPARNARLIIVVEEGEVLQVSIVPKHLQNCVEPLIRSRPFPVTTSHERDQITQTLKVP